MGVPELDEVLGLRRPRSLDVEGIAVIAGDPRTSQHIPAGAIAVEASSDLVKRWIDDWARDAVGYWVIEEPQSGDIVGWGGVRFVVTEHARLLNLAYRVAFSHWDRGIGTWVARRALATARARFPDVPVIARVAPDNVASARTAEKAGLRRVGHDRQRWPVYGDRDLASALLRGLPPA